MNDIKYFPLLEKNEIIHSPVNSDTTDNQIIQWCITNINGTIRFKHHHYMCKEF